MLERFAGHTPRLHDTAWVHDTAVVIGEVRLGRDVGIWPTAVLRGDMGPIEVGPHSNLQDAVVCHNTGGFSTTRVGARVTVGHRAILHGCRIEDDCLVGMGAIVMDNATIGSGSIVGAGAIVTVGKEVPPNSLVLGTPGRVVRETTEEDRERIAEAWQIYVDKARQWRARGD